MAEHRPERRVGQVRKRAPEGEPVRRLPVLGRPLGTHGAKDADGVRPHLAGGLEVGERGRPRWARYRDHPDDERGGVDAGVLAGGRKLLAEPVEVEHRPSVSHDCPAQGYRDPA